MPFEPALKAAIPDGLAQPGPDRRAGALETGAAFSARLYDTLEAVEPLWRHLQREGACTVYQTLAWTRGLARDVLPAEKVRLLIVEIADGVSGRPVMLLPFVTRRLWFGRVIEWLDLGVCDYACPILADGAMLTAAQAEAAWAAVKSALPPADLLMIDGIVPSVAGRANPLALLRQAVRADLQTFGIALQGDPASMLKRLCSASFVRDIGKCQRRLAREGEVRFVAAEGRDEVAALFEVLLEQRRRRFGAIGRADLLQQQHFVDFYRRAALDSIADGPVRLFGISVGGEWIATAYGLVHGGAFHGILLAMGDERWRRASPGLCLIADIVGWAGRQGLSYFDMTVGSLSYKAAMGAQSSDLFEIAEALTLRGRLILKARRASVSSKAWLRAHPHLFGRLRAVRQWLRRLGARTAP